MFSKWLEKFKGFLRSLTLRSVSLHKGTKISTQEVDKTSPHAGRYDEEFVTSAMAVDKSDNGKLEARSEQLTKSPPEKRDVQEIKCTDLDNAKFTGVRNLKIEEAGGLENFLSKVPISQLAELRNLELELRCIKEKGTSAEAYKVAGRTHGEFVLSRRLKSQLP